MTHRTAHSLIAAGAVMVISIALATPASAGIDWFQIGVGPGGFHLSLGASDYWAWDDGWHDPAWSIDFHSSLAGYGEWMWVDGLGQVWRPYVAASWSPYTHGRWVYTTLGWTWVAYEPWGYVPHHFGNWARTHAGWVWLPGSTYTPANVVWVNYNHYVGWYACPPRGWSHYHRGYHRGYDRGYRHGHHDGYRHGYGDGYEDGWRDAMYANYVDWGHLGSDNVAGHVVPRHQVQPSISRSSVQRLAGAPRRQDVERRTGQRVRSVPVETRRVTVGNREVEIMRPQGLGDSIERHARPTAERALAPSVSRRLDNPRELVERRSDRSGSSPSSGGVIHGTTGRSSRTSTGSISSGHRSTAPRVSQERTSRAPAAGSSTSRSSGTVVWPRTQSGQDRIDRSSRSGRAPTASDSSRRTTARVPSGDRTRSSAQRPVTAPRSSSSQVHRSAPTREQRSSAVSRGTRAQSSPGRTIAPRSTQQSPQRATAPRSSSTSQHGTRSMTPRRSQQTGSSRSITPRRSSQQPQAHSSHSGERRRATASTSSGQRRSSSSASSSPRPTPRPRRQ